MTLTNMEVTTLYEGLQRLRERSSVALPVSIGFVIIQDMKLLQPTYEAVMETRSRIYLEHREYIDESSGMIKVKDEDIKVVNEQLQELGNITNELELKRIPLPQLESLCLTLDDINTLYPIIEPTSE